MYFRRLFSLFQGTAEDKAGVDIVAKRFLQAFQAHGIELSQIQRFLPNITLDCLQSEGKLLAALNHDVLFRTSELFGIRLAWLEGVDDQIYEHLGCYKRPQVILDDLNRLPRDQDGEIEFPLRVITTQMNLDYRGGCDQMLVPVVVEKTAELGEIDVCRYRIYMDGFTWDYWPTRMELKAIARIVFKQLHMPVPLFRASAKEVEALVAGRMFPGAFVHGCQLTNPSLEDFALWRSESQQSKEEDELPEVLLYIEEHQLENFKFDISNDSEAGSLPAEDLPPLVFASDRPLDTSLAQHEQFVVTSVVENAVKAAQASHAATNAIKDRFIRYYQEEGQGHPNKKAAAAHFYQSLLEKRERLQFAHEDAAIRTLLAGLRNYEKAAK